MKPFKMGSAQSKEANNFLDRQSEGEGDIEESRQSSGPDSSTGNKEKETSTSSFSLARAETRMVAYSKVLVLFVIAIFTVAIGTVTYKFVKKQEHDDYEAKFHVIANEITEFTQLKMEYILDDLKRFSVSLTSYAEDTNKIWPFVVFPGYQVEGMLSNEATGAHTLTLNPIVQAQVLDEWTKFSVDNQGWLATAHAYDTNVHEELYVPEVYDTYDTQAVHSEDSRWNVTGIVPYVWRHEGLQSDGSHEEVKVGPAAYYTPVWQRAPAPDFHPDVNLDLRSIGVFDRFIDGMIEFQHPVITEITDATYLASNYEHRFSHKDQDEPHSYLLQPVYNNLTDGREMVAFLSAFVRWGIFFDDVLAEAETGIAVVLRSSCSHEQHTYEIFGHHAEYLGAGDLHDSLVHGDDIVQEFEIAPALAAETGKSSEHHFCHYKVQIHPTDEWKASHFSNDPYLYSMGVVGCFVITTLVFAFYDMLVQRRQNKVMASAKRTNAIVNSLFPANIRDRLLEEVNNEEGKKKGSAADAFLNTGKSQAITSEDIFGSKPIADLFPETTIMFADMVGFTAWSSVREPCQVFSLLETLYHSFDVIAKRRRVFKVETVGDCYVAVAGLPVPRKDHAIIMVKFSNDILMKMKELLKSLETSLGPDTAELDLRVGLHSGPVTAGVLRGEKGRFQLFGDTMNTASRMESTGLPGKIHCTNDTATILAESGRDKWITERQDTVVAKGKGTMKTFWIRLHTESACTGSHMTSQSGNSKDEGANERPKQKELALGTHVVADEKPKTRYDALPQKMQRLVTWNVEILLKNLKQIIARRAAVGALKAPSKRESRKMTNSNGHVLDEVKDVLNLPQFDAKSYLNQIDSNNIELSEEVVFQMTDMIARIASLYHDNHFHSFEHASHVTMSVTKLMSRIVQPNEVSTANCSDDQIAANLHDHTFGITSDPLTQFACVLSALIHDADHPGVPNSTLVKEEHPLAEKYCGKSVAEQNSVDLAWDIVMSSEYKELQTCIFGNKEEYGRFRSIIVNVVMATDIMDKDLGAARKARWEKAFAGEDDQQAVENDKAVVINRKATIVLEHLMQASDVAHTMQHWHVFKKWNERLFCELYQAYVDGRTESDPSKGWYQGEMGFFDFYIIPLAKKLETCGVFGVSSSEYLNYAQKNRLEWEHKGEQLVKEYVERFHAQQATA